MALYDIVLPTDHVTVSDVVARQLNAGVVAKVFDIQISDEISVVDSLPTDVIISDTIEVTDSIQAIIIDTLTIANARALSATKVRIDFSVPAADPTNGGNPALTNVASYVFTPISPGAVGVVPQSVDLPPGQTEPQYVEINITEHTDGAIYQVSLSSAIQGANSEVGGGPAFSYAGKGASPVVERVFATSATEVIVFFDEQILDNPAANDVANYVWDHGISTVAVKSVIGNLVTLETTEQTEGELYLLTVRGIFQVVINDVIQVTDAQPIPNLHTVWAFDEVDVTDQLKAETDYVRQVDDAVDVTDQLQVDFTQDRVVNDAVAVTDSLQVEATYDRTISDAIAVADAIDEAVNLYQIEISDTISVTDLIMAGIQTERVISDAIAVTDNLIAEFTAGASLTLPSSFGSARTSPGSPELQVSADGTNWTSTNLVPYPNETPRNGARNFATGTIIYCCDNGCVIKSTDEGQTWANINAGAALGIPLTFDFTAVWFGNGRWIMAGSLPGTGGQLYYSDDDGASWTGPIDPDGGTGTGPTTTAPAGFSDVFYDGIYVATLGLHIGVGYRGAIWTSPDGINWTERVADNSYAGGFYGFRGIEWSESQGLLVAGGDPDECQTSPDGINWTKQTLAAAPAITTVWGVCYSPTLDLWSLHGNGASNLPNLQTSPDGVNWTNRSLPSPNNHSLYSGGWDSVNELFIMAGRFGRCHNSADGINYTYTPPDNSVSPFVGNTSASIFAFIGGGDGGGQGK